MHSSNSKDVFSHEYLDSDVDVSAVENRYVSYTVLYSSAAAISSGLIRRTQPLIAFTSAHFHPLAPPDLIRSTLNRTCKSAHHFKQTSVLNDSETVEIVHAALKNIGVRYDIFYRTGDLSQQWPSSTVSEILKIPPSTSSR
ncbi:hypothetical protein QTP88_016458 [Uroleucon formosanum]